MDVAVIVGLGVDVTTAVDVGVKVFVCVGGIAVVVTADVGIADAVDVGGFNTVKFVSEVSVTDPIPV